MKKTLRAHHGMCLSFFEGKGYSDEFTIHMGKILDEMSENPMLFLIASEDRICEKCPNLKKDGCITRKLVENYDRQVLEFCGLKEKTSISWEEFSSLVREKILYTGKRSLICGDCQWDEICRRQEEKRQRK